MQSKEHVMQISLAKHVDATPDLSGMEVLRQDLQQLEHRISRLSRHRFVTYGVTALSIASGLVFFLLALSDTLPGPLRHVITHMAGHPGLLSGSLPVIISITAVMVGAGMSVANQSVMPIVAGVGMATMLYLGPQVIGGVTSANQQPSSCSSSGAHRRTLGCMLQGTKGHPYPAEYVQAQRIAFAIDHHKPVTAARRANLEQDLTWISAHFPAISAHQFYQLDVAAYGHPTSPRAQAYAQSIISTKTAHEAAYEDSLGAAGAMFGSGLLLDALLLTMKRNRKQFMSRAGKLG
jgi:hypothetical protein